MRYIYIFFFLFIYFYIWMDNLVYEMSNRFNNQQLWVVLANKWKKKIQKGNIRNIFINKYQLSWLIKRSLMTYEYVKLSCLSIVNFRLFSQNEPSLHFIPTFIDESCVEKHSDSVFFDSAFLRPRPRLCGRCSRESVENDVCGNEWVTV